MPTGTVKWFNNAKGYGFILPDQGSEDLFVHYTSIVMEGYKTLKAGQVVSFDIVKGGKGLHATNIQSPESSSNTGSDPDVSSDSGSVKETSEKSKQSEIEAIT